MFRNKDTNQIVDLDLVEDEIAADMAKDYTEAAFEKKCSEGQLYQLEVPELQLLTSMQACYYVQQSGLNDTLSFSTNREGSRLVGMHVDTKDIKHLASLERNPRKKRLMQERQYEKFVGKAVLSKMIAGAQPEFAKAHYDTLGSEKKNVPIVGADGKVQEAPPPQQEQTFMQKYWWYIVIGFLVIQTLGTAADPENKGGQGGAQGGGGARPAPQRRS